MVNPTTPPASRELVVLGSASQVPTRERNHNGYFLRWDSAGFLFDPGEGTQRQMLLAGVKASAIQTICLTHAHGDHCLGLPGVLQRRVVDNVGGEVQLCFPAPAQPYVDALRSSSATSAQPPVAEHPVSRDGVVLQRAGWTLSAAALDHREPAVGWRLDEPPKLEMLPQLLADAGVRGPLVGELQRAGEVLVGGRTVRLEAVSRTRPGQSFALVMDTRLCDGARRLAAGVDLLVCESTYLARDAHLAEEYGHLTARQAGELAAEAGARRLVLTHFSRRYGNDIAPFVAEAGEVFGDVMAAEDLLGIAVPPRTGT